MKNKLVLTLLAFFIIGCSTTTPAISAPTISPNFTLEKKQRVNRTEFDYSYYVHLNNDGNAIKSISAIATSGSENTTIIDSTVNFNDMAGNTNSKSIDTFTIRQNRGFYFDPTSISWDIRYENDTDDNNELPPAPGEAGNQTVEGIDSDNDGVRDDVQIAIVEKYPDNNSAVLALNQFSKAIQQAIIAKNNNEEQGLNNAIQKILDATDCISISSPDPWSDTVYVEMFMINTPERRDLYNEVNGASSGRFFGGGEDFSANCEG